MIENQVIQMNMEIALVCAQLCVMAGARAADNHDLVKNIFIIIFSSSSSSDGVVSTDIHIDSSFLHNGLHIHVPRGSSHLQVQRS